MRQRRSSAPASSLRPPVSMSAATLAGAGANIVTDPIAIRVHKVHPGAGASVVTNPIAVRVHKVGPATGAGTGAVLAPVMAAHRDRRRSSGWLLGRGTRRREGKDSGQTGGTSRTGKP